MGDFNADFGEFEEYCQQVVEDYLSQYDRPLPLTHREVFENTNPEAEREDVEKAAMELFDFFDELLNVESSDNREQWKGEISYDENRFELMKKDSNLKWLPLCALPASYSLGSMAADSFGLEAGLAFGGATGILLGGLLTYAGISLTEIGHNRIYGEEGVIGVNTGKLPKRRAYDVLAAELIHAYQDDFESITYNGSKALKEGFERSIRIRTLEYFEQEKFDGLDWSSYRDKFQTYVVLDGLHRLKTEHDDRFETTEIDWLNLTEERLEIWKEYQENKPSERQYTPIAGAIQKAYDQGDKDIHKRVFHSGGRALPDCADKYQREFAEYELGLRDMIPV